MFTLESYDELGAESHQEFVSFVLGLFGKYFCNVAALIGDTCPKNKSFERRARCRFYECASHR